MYEQNWRGVRSEKLGCFVVSLDIGGKCYAEIYRITASKPWRWGVSVSNERFMLSFESRNLDAVKARVIATYTKYGLL